VNLACIYLIITCLLFCAAPLSASIGPQTLVRGDTIDGLLERAIAGNLIAGGVVVVGNHDGILQTIARGRINEDPHAPLLNEQTIFDIASLTKVIATAPAVMKLLEDGSITLQDPLTRWFPEFAGSDRKDITILNLLTHTSGLEDVELGGEDPMKTAIRKVAEQKCRYQPGSHFRYADINFILLGEMVRRVSGMPLDRFCQERIYTPLAASETMFLPPAELAVSIAPTGGTACGIVQDPNARRLDGVAGHAGLFSSATDLARFARLILGGGAIDGTRIISKDMVNLMTSPYACGEGTVIRGLGWDIDSPFSSPKGNLFSKGSFGHTGYSGSSIWIDPRQDLFVILLTTRLNYRDTGVFNRLRRDISTVAAANYRPLTESVALPQSGPAELTDANPHARQIISPPRRAGKHVAQLHSHRKGHAKKHARHRIARAERRIAKACASRHASARKRRS